MLAFFNQGKGTVQFDKNILQCDKLNSNNLSVSICKNDLSLSFEFAL